MSEACPDSLTLRLRRLDACAVSDAMDKLGLSGCVTGLAPLSVRARIAGPVHTVRLVPKDKAPAEGKPRHLGATAIEASNPGELIVVEQAKGVDAGSWGGILSLGAKIRGVAGVIADGPVRDADEAEQIGFPVYGRCTTARTARNRVVELGTDIPITVGGIAVAPGDYAIADSSAVVFLPRDKAESIISEAEIIARREALMAKSLMSGQPITEVMGADYEHMLR